LRRGLEAGLSRLRGRDAQVVLRDLKTLSGNRDRLHVWTRLAIRAAEKHAWSRPGQPRWSARAGPSVLDEIGRFRVFTCCNGAIR
jgi:hypothetical protein